MSHLFPEGLSMLWEPADAAVELPARFGLRDVDDAARWFTDTLREHWGLDVSGCTRVVISDINAIAWLATDRGPVVVKACCRPEVFERLAVTAAAAHALAGSGIPVAAPLLTRDGTPRAVVDGPDRPLSVIVQPEVDGDVLDAHDPAPTFAAGAVLARLHVVLAGTDVGPLPDARGRVEDPAGLTISGAVRDRAPRAAARLESLTPGLPHLGAGTEPGPRPQPVHGDYRGANILTRGADVVAVLDLDEMGVDHRVGDLARAATLVGTRFTQWWPAPPGAGHRLLDGYRSVTTLTDAEGAWLEALLLWHGLHQVPAGDDPHGWAAAVERWVR